MLFKFSYSSKLWTLQRYSTQFTWFQSVESVKKSSLAPCQLCQMGASVCVGGGESACCARREPAEVVGKVRGVGVVGTHLSAVTKVLGSVEPTELYLALAAKANHPGNIRRFSWLVCPHHHVVSH